MRIFAENENMADRKIIHLHLNGQDYYFGSVAAIYSRFTKEELGVSYGSLRNYGISPDRPYTNGKVTIKEGVLIAAKGMRGRKAAERQRHTIRPKAVLLDFDCSIFDTRIDREARKAKDFDLICSKIVRQYTLYDGWKSVFAWMKDSGIKVGIVSSAKTDIIKAAFSFFNIDCDGIVGWQLYHRKPDPKLIDMALNKLDGIPKDDAIYIGDSLEDRKMAESAGIRFVAATWDCENVNETEELKKGEHCSSPIQIIDLLS